jgi:hypothetical protein
MEGNNNMLITLTEVVEKRNNYSSAEVNRSFTLREVTVNPRHVVCLREDINAPLRLKEGSLPEGLDARQRFTKLYLDRGQAGIDIIVVGSPTQVQETLGLSAKELLKG